MCLTYIPSGLTAIPLFPASLIKLKPSENFTNFYQLKWPHLPAFALISFFPPVSRGSYQTSNSSLPLGALSSILSHLLNNITSVIIPYFVLLSSVSFSSNSLFDLCLISFIRTLSLPLHFSALVPLSNTTYQKN